MRGVRQMWPPAALQGHNALLLGQAVWLRFDDVRGRAEGELPGYARSFVAQRIWRRCFVILPVLLLLQSAASAAVENAQRIAADGLERVLVYVASDEVDEAMGYVSSAIIGIVGGGSRISVLNSQHVREFFESRGGDTSLLPMVSHTLSTVHIISASVSREHCVTCRFLQVTCHFTAIPALTADRQIQRRAPEAPNPPPTCRWTSSS